MPAEHVLLIILHRWVLPLPANITVPFDLGFGVWRLLFQLVCPLSAVCPTPTTLPRPSGRSHPLFHPLLRPVVGPFQQPASLQAKALPLLLRRNLSAKTLLPQHRKGLHCSADQCSGLLCGRAIPDQRHPAEITVARYDITPAHPSTTVRVHDSSMNPSEHAAASDCVRDSSSASMEAAVMGVDSGGHDHGVEAVEVGGQLEAVEEREAAAPRTRFAGGGHEAGGCFGDKSQCIAFGVGDRSRPCIKAKLQRDARKKAMANAATAPPPPPPTTHNRPPSSSCPCCSTTAAAPIAASGGGRDQHFPGTSRSGQSRNSRNGGYYVLSPSPSHSAPKPEKAARFSFLSPPPAFPLFSYYTGHILLISLEREEKMRKGKEKRNAPWGPEDKRAGPGERGAAYPHIFYSVVGARSRVSGFSPHCSLPHHSGTAVPLCILRGRAALQGPPPASYLWRLAGLVVPQRAIRE